MGRSNMQGTPWHYEYLSTNKPRKKRNSINCVYNSGRRCTCTVSKNHGNNCVGQNNCMDFERCSFRRPEIYANRPKQKQNTYKKPIKKEDNNKKTIPKFIVELGDTVVVKSLLDSEVYEITLSDRKNPFFMKRKNEKITLRGEEYIITDVIKRRYY